MSQLFCLQVWLTQCVPFHKLWVVMPWRSLTSRRVCRSGRGPFSMNSKPQGGCWTRTLRCFQRECHCFMQTPVSGFSRLTLPMLLTLLSNVPTSSRVTSVHECGLGETLQEQQKDQAIFELVVIQICSPMCHQFQVHVTKTHGKTWKRICEYLLAWLSPASDLPPCKGSPYWKSLWTELLLSKLASKRNPYYISTRVKEDLTK